MDADFGPDLNLRLGHALTRLVAAGKRSQDPEIKEAANEVKAIVDYAMAREQGRL